MRRFFVFPPLFAAWFFAGQFGLMVLSRAGTYAAFHFSPPNTDVYLITNRTSLSFFSPAIAVGAIVGCLFAALDFALNRNGKTSKETLSQLLRNGIRSGLIVMTLILLCQGILLVLAAQENHRRYHAYPPDIAWLNLIRVLQPLLLLASLLWTVVATLMSPRMKARKAV